MQSKIEPQIRHEEKEKEKQNKQCSSAENDPLYKCDDEAQLIGQLQEKLEMSREEIKQILQKL